MIEKKYYPLFRLFTENKSLRLNQKELIALYGKLEEAKNTSQPNYIKTLFL